MICEAAIQSLKNKLLVEEYAEHSNIYPSNNFRENDNCQNEASTDLHHMSGMTLSQLQVLDEVRRFWQLSIDQLKIFHWITESGFFVSKIISIAMVKTD